MIPKKAIREIELAEHQGAPPPSSGHLVKKVDFINNPELSGLGFLKYCEKRSYCELHAKYTVGLSVLYRSTLGDRAAQERLVYNNQDQIVGTVSVAIPNFIPMQNITDSSSSHFETTALANPTQNTLDKKNIAELLVASWRHKEDDLHPGNISTEGRIDFDMSWYNHVASVLKGERVTCGTLQTTPALGTILQEEDLHHFPRLNSTRTHWPSHPLPENGNAAKTYKSQAVFKNLSKSKKFEAQMFSALLKELLSFQTNPLKERLKVQLGNERINLDSLKSKSESANKKKDKLLNLLETSFFYDTSPTGVLHEKKIVENIIAIAEHEFNSFYKVVINYSKFGDFLKENPNAYFQARTFFEEENKKYQVKQKYDLKEMDLMYQKIWSDSARQSLLKQLGETKELLDKLEVNDNMTLFQSIKTLPPKEPTSDSTTTLPAPPEHAPSPKTLPTLSIIKNSIEGLYLVITKESKAFFANTQPTLQMNHLYIEKCQQQLMSANQQLDQIDSQSHQAPYKQEVNHLLSTWDQTLADIKFPNIGEPPKQSISPSIKYYSSKTATKGADKPISLDENINSVLKTTFFSWLAKQKLNDLTVDIHIALKEYKPQWSLIKTFFGSRKDSVMAIISKAQVNNFSATMLLKNIIFEDNSGWESTSLNTIIMKILTQKMLADATSDIENSPNRKSLLKFKTLLTRGKINIESHFQEFITELQTAEHSKHAPSQGGGAAEEPSRNEGIDRIVS